MTLLSLPLSCLQRQRRRHSFFFLPLPTRIRPSGFAAADRRRGGLLRRDNLMQWENGHTAAFFLSFFLSLFSHSQRCKIHSSLAVAWACRFRSLFRVSFLCRALHWAPTPVVCARPRPLTPFGHFKRERQRNFREWKQQQKGPVGLRQLLPQGWSTAGLVQHSSAASGLFLHLCFCYNRD